jgi:hypothetical protein
VEIKWCVTDDGLMRVPIEPRITDTVGADRYRVVAYGERWLVVPLDPKDSSSGHPDHRTRCPR